MEVKTLEKNGNKPSETKGDEGGGPKNIIKSLGEQKRSEKLHFRSL